MKPNNENDNCASCGQDKGVVPIADEENSYWICEYCDSEMFDNSIESKGLEPREIESTFSIVGLTDEQRLEIMRELK